MRMHPYAARRLAPLVAVLVACGFLTAMPLPVADAAANLPGEDAFLVRTEDIEHLGIGPENARSVGFGWHLVDIEAVDIAETGSPQFVARAQPNTIYALADDPLFDDLWHLENTGQTGGVLDADIDILDAWTFADGSGGPVIAFLDTGVDLDHPDLMDRLWVNRGETPGNGIDDDANGYIDDLVGWDFIDADALPDDVHGHGTRVAGIAAASLNDTGIVGAAPGTTIMPLRVCAASCPLAAIVEAISYAITNGASVINLSLGTHSHDQPLEDAIRGALEAGVIATAAAGNDAADNDGWPFFPAGFDLPNVLSVASTDHADALAGTSNFGLSTVDIAAPGEAVLTTTIGDWEVGSGTSYAAPLVAATAALVLDVNPGSSVGQVREFILGSATPVPSLDGLVATGARLDAGAAVAAASVPAARATATPEVGVVPVALRLDGRGSSDPDGSIDGWTWSSGTGSWSSSTVDLALDASGVYTFTLAVEDDRGAIDTDTVTVFAGVDFTDTRSSVFRTDITWMSAVGITSGCNPPFNDRFCPRASMTRQQLASILVTSLELPATATDYFVDDDGSIHEDSINRLAAAGVTVGCNPPSSDRFCPTDHVTRAQLASMLVAAFKVPASPLDAFSDDEGSPHESAVNALAAIGVTKGCNPPDNTGFCPRNPVTRQQIAAFLRRILA